MLLGWSFGECKIHSSHRAGCTPSARARGRPGIAKSGEGIARKRQSAGHRSGLTVGCRGLPCEEPGLVLQRFQVLDEGTLLAVIETQDVRLVVMVDDIGERRKPTVMVEAARS